MKAYPTVSVEAAKRPALGRIWVKVYLVAVDQIGWFPSESRQVPHGVIALALDCDMIAPRDSIESYHDHTFDMDRPVIWSRGDVAIFEKSANEAECLVWFKAAALIEDSLT